MRLSLGNWGIAWTVDFWQGELQVRLGRVGLHFASAFVDREWKGEGARWWSGVRLYLGTGSMRLVDGLEWPLEAEEMFPALAWLPSAPGLDYVAVCQPLPAGRALCRLRAVWLAWTLWNIIPHGDDPYDNVSLRAAWAVAKGIWLDGVA